MATISVAVVGPESFSASEIIDRLELVAHPTCGFVAETYRGAERIAAGGLAPPFTAGRPIGSAASALLDAFDASVPVTGDTENDRS